MNADNRNRFSCMTSFWHLNGYRKQCVFIGDHPDARASSPLIKDRIKHNWPSQRSKKYKHGYIELQSGKKLNLETQTIYGKPAYIFDCTHKIESYCRQQTAEQKIRDSVNNKLSGDDRNTALSYSPSGSVTIAVFTCMLCAKETNSLGNCNLLVCATWRILPHS